MPKHLCVLAAAVMLLNGAAAAHSWYPKECCHDKDCHPVPCAEIHVEPDGSVRFGRVYFPPNMIHESRDAYCHVCTSFPNAENLNEIPQCVFVPQATS
jgi:hypothetical protein